MQLTAEQLKARGSLLQPSSQAPCLVHACLHIIFLILALWGEHFQSAHWKELASRLSS